MGANFRINRKSHLELNFGIKFFEISWACHYYTHAHSLRTDLTAALVSLIVAGERELERGLLGLGT